MSRTATRRLLASSPLNPYCKAPSICRSFQCFQLRPFSRTTLQLADKSKATPTPPTSPSNTSSSMANLANIFEQNQATRASRSSATAFLDTARISSIGSAGYSPTGEPKFVEPHHLHIYATRHNTHITLTAPNRNALISVSAGNIGFKKSGRKHYDSAFQLAGYVMKRIQDQGLLPQIKQLELCLRGYGAGREAVTKALLGNEGRLLRPKVVKVSDATRLKFGGTRSPKPRRLG